MPNLVRTFLVFPNLLYQHFHLFHDENARTRERAKTERTKQLGKRAMTFMRSALAMDPADRVTSREAVCHPLFEGLFEDYASRHPHLQQRGDDVGGGVGGAGSLQVGNANGSGGVLVGGGGGGGGTRCVKNNCLGNNGQPVLRIILL